MTDRAEEVVNNVWIRLIGRAGSVITAIVGALMIPAIIGIWSWAVETGNDLDALRSRVIVLETNGGRAGQFQEQTKAALSKLLEIAGAVSERQARVETKVEGIQHQLDKP